MRACLVAVIAADQIKQRSLSRVLKVRLGTRCDWNFELDLIKRENR